MKVQLKRKKNLPKKITRKKSKNDCMSNMKIDNNKGCGKVISTPLFHTFFIHFLWVSVSLLTTLGYADTEIRGLWVVRDSIVSRSMVEQVVNFADSSGFNVLFVQVRGRGDAYYRSNFVPGPEEFPYIPDTFDPLATVIELAHARGIEVHAWFNMYLTWSEDKNPLNPLHIVNTHPGWFMVSINGVSMADCPMESIRNHTIVGRYISPGLEEVRSYLSRVITEVLVRYNIDGVHMDYIRYPGRSHDFHDRIRQHYKRRYGVDPVAVVLDGANIDVTMRYLEKWVDYRSDQIDTQVRSVARRIKIVNKDICLSAAVKPDVSEAYYEFGQNWAGWLREEIVDFVVTMSYFPETAWVEDVLNDSLKNVDRKKVLGGIGAYKLTPGETADQIKLMRNMGLMGYCIFSYTTLNSPHFAESLKALTGPGTSGQEGK